MNDFWSRKRDELQAKGELPVPRSEPVSGPWWAHGTNLLPRQEIEPQQPVQRRAEAPREGGCPNCQSGDYSRATSSTAARCFDCGYVQGRQLNAPNMPSGLLSSGAQTLQVRQLGSQGGHFGRSVAEINANAAVLEQSANGRTKLG
jgi:hypothetical protein